LIKNHFFGGTFPWILVFSSSRWEEEKKNKANLGKNFERLKVNKTVTTLQQLEINLPVLLL